MDSAMIFDLFGIGADAMSHNFPADNKSSTGIPCPLPVINQ
jgi:hypothetical protein